MGLVARAKKSLAVALAGLTLVLAGSSLASAQTTMHIRQPFTLHSYKPGVDAAIINYDRTHSGVPRRIAPGSCLDDVVGVIPWGTAVEVYSQVPAVPDGTCAPFPGAYNVNWDLIYYHEKWAFVAAVDVRP